MIVMFQGGGPAAGLYKNFPTEKSEIRVATAESLADGMAAVYVVGVRERIAGLRVTSAVADYSGMRKTATSHVDLIVE